MVGSRTPNLLAVCGEDASPTESHPRAIQVLLGVCNPHGNSTMRYDHLGFAILLSLPPGVGVALAVLRTAGTSSSYPLALGAGTVTTLVIFVVVFAGIRPGSDARESEGTNVDAERDGS